MDEAGINVATLAAKVAAAEAETKAVRDKLHAAVRKGKAIDAEKRTLAKELDSLRAQLNASDASTVVALSQTAAQHSTELQAAVEQAGSDAYTQAHAQAAAAFEPQLAEIKAQWQASQTSISDRDARIARLSAQSESERQTAVVATERWTSTQAELQTLQGRLATAQSEASQSKEAIEKLELAAAASAKLETAAINTQGNGGHSTSHDDDVRGAAEVASLGEQLQAATAAHALLVQQQQERDEQASVDKASLVSLEEAGNRRAAAAEAMAAALASEVDMMRAAMGAAAERVQHAVNAKDTALAALEIKESELMEGRRRLAEAEGALSVADNVEAALRAAREDAYAARAQYEEVCEKLRETAAEADGKARRVQHLETQLLEALNSESDRESASDGEKTAALAAAEAMQREAEKQLAAARAARAEAAEAASAVDVRAAAVVGAVAAADRRTALAEEAMEKLQREHQERQQRFSLVNQSFTKREAGLLDRAEAAEQAITEWRARAQHAEHRLAAAEEDSAAARQDAEEAGDALEAAVGAATAQAGSRIAVLEQQLSAFRSSAAAAQQQNAQHEETLARASRAEDLLAAAQRQLAQHQQLLQEGAGEAAATRQEAATALQMAESATKEKEVVSRKLEAAKIALLEAEAVAANRLSTSNLAERERLPISEAHENGSNSPDAEALAKLQAENTALAEKVKGVDKRIAGAAAVQHAKVATLEKQNRDLSWQVAMLADKVTAPVAPRRAAPGSVPSATKEDPGKGTVAGVVGWILAHRKALTILYLVLMHALVYFALTHGVFSRTHNSECASPASMLGPPGSLTAAASNEASTIVGGGLRTTAGKMAMGGGEGMMVNSAQLAGGTIGPTGSEMSVRSVVGSLAADSPASGGPLASEGRRLLNL